MIETESGRGEAYADDPRIPGGYAVLSLRDDFSPRAFGEALAHAEKEEVDALILDSASHEWDAVGGVRHMAAMNEEGGKKGMLVWQTPKMDHQRHFMLPLLSTPIPLVILCMRARYPMEENPTKKGDWKRAEALVPYQSDTILFEMFAHGWIDRAHKFHGTKWTRDELRQVIRENEPITLETGQRLQAWAKGGTTASRQSEMQPATAATTSGPSARAETGGAPSEWELVVNDFREQIDGAKTSRDAKGWMDAWETRKKLGDIPAEGLTVVDEALERARTRLLPRR